MTFGIDNPEGGCNNPPLGKYVWEKPSGEQGLIKNLSHILDQINNSNIYFVISVKTNFCTNEI